jgi:Tfp pilus assembly protein PilO
LALGDLSEKQLLGLTAGVVAAILLVMAGILLWMYMRYKGLLDEIKAKNATAVAMEKKARDLKDVEQTYEEYMTRFQDARKQVPDESQLTELDAQISEQAANAKLNILKIEPVKERSTRKKTKQTGNLETIKLRIEAAGSFNAFGQFLNNIEQNMGRFVAVTGFTIAAYEEGLAPGKGPHEIELNLVTYRYVGKKKPDRAASPAARAPR